MKRAKQLQPRLRRIEAARFRNAAFAMAVDAFAACCDALAKDVNDYRAAWQAMSDSVAATFARIAARQIVGQMERDGMFEPGFLGTAGATYTGNSPSA